MSHSYERDQAVSEAIKALREDHGFRAWVKNPESEDKTPAAVLTESGKANIYLLDRSELAEYLRVIEAEEAARAAADEALGVAKGEFEVPDDIDGDNAEIARLFHGSGDEGRR